MVKIWWENHTHPIGFSTLGVALDEQNEYSGSISYGSAHTTSAAFCTCTTSTATTTSSSYSRSVKQWIRNGVLRWGSLLLLRCYSWSTYHTIVENVIPPEIGPFEWGSRSTFSLLLFKKCKMCVCKLVWMLLGIYFFSPSSGFKFFLIPTPIFSLFSTHA